MKFLLELLVAFILFMLLTDGKLTIQCKLFTWNWSVEILKNWFSKVFAKKSN